MESGEPFEHKGERITPKSRTFIPARVEDNPHYMASGYKATLQALPEPLRAKLLYGDFSASREDNPYQLIPTEWLELAVKRHESGRKPDRPLSCIGVDVARGGKDRTVITLRYDHWFEPQRVYPGNMTPDGDTVAQLVLAARLQETCKVNIDVIGVGSSVYDSLRRHIGDKARAFNSSHGSDARDKSGQLTFANRRAEWWWLLREALDPHNGENLALPQDRELIADLAAPRYKLGTHGILIEGKDEIVKRIGRSPDKADSVVYAFAKLSLPGEGYIEFYERAALESL